ncbi:MAG: hypothetical protein JXP34_06805 [Planctomycetes bacterium]|nr:hypothetical protein [Planctomycetota bacterium]
MKRIACALAAVLLSGCTLGRTLIEVFPDGSGRITYSESAAAPAPEPRDDLGCEGLRIRSITEVRVKVREYEFDDLSRVSLGGIRFAFATEGERVSVEMTIPFDRELPWVRGLRLSERKIRDVRALLRRVTEEQEPGASQIISEDRILRVEFAVKMPGRVLDAKVLRPESDAPAWARPIRSDSPTKTNEVTISIPAEELLRMPIEALVVRIVSEKGPLPGVRSRWERFSRGREKAGPPAPGSAPRAGEKKDGE